MATKLFVMPPVLQSYGAVSAALDYTSNEKHSLTRASRAKKSLAARLLWFSRRATSRRLTAVHEANRQMAFAAIRLGIRVCDAETLEDIVDNGLEGIIEPGRGEDDSRASPSAFERASPPSW